MRALIKKIIPQKLVLQVQKYLEFQRGIILSLSAKKDHMAGLYYLLMNPAFHREHRAVLNGRIEYQLSLDDMKESSALLRRNIHRIEKGLIMVPRRDIFAENFIKDTVDCFAKVIASEDICKAEKKWATDVLNEYFSIVADTLIISRAKMLYYEALKSYKVSSEGKTAFKPYSHNDLVPLDINCDQLNNLFLHRRSVRWYKEQTVPRDLIEKAVDMASLAPSACNRQPYKFLFTNDKARVFDIASCAMGTAGFRENIPSILVVTGDLSFYPLERDRHVIYIDASLASMQLMLALETLGLSSCPINWPDIDENENEILKIIDLKPSERVIMLIAVGYADPTGGIPYSQKKKQQIILKDI